MTIPQHHFKQIEPHFTLREHIADCLNARGLVVGSCCVAAFTVIATAAIFFYAGVWMP